MNETPTAEPPAAESKPLLKSPALIGALIVVLAFVLYWPALRGPMVWDDLLTVQQNPLVTGKANLASVWFQEDFSLTNIALWLQWSVWNKNPLGYHVVNVLLHAANVFLVWRLLTRLKIPGAGLAALLFAVHPVCVASVAWISEIKNTLSLLFTLLSLLWFIRFEEDAGNPATARRWYWFSIGAFMLALLAKTAPVTLPVVMLGLAWWRRGGITKTDFKRIAPYLVLSLVFGLRSIWFQAQTRSGAAPGDGFASGIAIAGRAIWFYLGTALFPLKLNLIYPRWEANAGSVVSYLPLLAFFAVLGACWWFRRTWARHVFFALACFAILLFPILGFFKMSFFAVSRVSDHLQYLPLIVIMTAVAAALKTLCPPKALPMVTPALVAVLSLLTFQRAGVFATDEGLWRDTLAKNPASWNAHNNLACALAEKKQLPEAVREFEASLQLNPRNYQAHVNLGLLFMNQNQLPLAERHFQAALKLRSDDANTHRAYGQMLANAGKLPPAIEHLREAVRLSPDLDTRVMLAQLYLAVGRQAEAAEEYRRILAINPDIVDALNNLAGILATTWDPKVRNGKEAVQCAARAVKLTENKNPSTMGTLAAALAEAGRFPEAVNTAQMAVKLATAAGNQQLVAMHTDLAKLYATGKAYHAPDPTAAPTGPKK